MKFNEEAMDEATRRYASEGARKDIYENAPEGAKKRLRVAFWGTCFLKENEDLDAYRLRRLEIENHEMSVEDAAYLADKFPEGLDGKRHYRELRNTLILAPLRTDAKLDDAMDAMTERWSKEDRLLFERSRAAYRLRDDPFGVCTYPKLWKAVGGDGDSCGLLADVFNHGHDVDCDEELAVFWWRRGAMCGDEDCLRELAKKLSDSTSSMFDMAESIFWFMEGVRRNLLTVKREVGRLLAFGEGEWTKLRNPKLAISLLQSCADMDESGLTHYYIGLFFEKRVDPAYDENTSLMCAKFYYLLGKNRNHKPCEEAYERLNQ